MNTRTLLPGLLAAACIPGAASADFTDVSVEDVSSLVGTPPGLTTYRLYVNFDTPVDQLLGISGNPDVGALAFQTDAPDGLVNAGGALAGLKAEDFAGAPISLPWDSWVTIDHEVSAGNDTDYTPGFLGGDGVHAVIGPAWCPVDNGGWFDSDPGTAADGGHIVIAQFTLPEGSEFSLEGTVDYEPDGSPPSISEFFSWTWPWTYPCDETVEHVSTSPPTDLDGSGATDFGDLLAVLSAWGPCTPGFEIVAQDRSFGGGVIDDCECTSTLTIADGFGAWDHAWAGQHVHTTVRDDGMSLDGTSHTYCCDSPCFSDWAGGHVQFVLDVNVALPFTFVADAQPEGEAGDISLTGPGLDLTAPIDTAGILAPGQYVLDAAIWAVCGYLECDAAFDSDLALGGTRCAADVDRNGLVDWLDLLRVLSEWGLSVQPGACCLPDGSCADTVAYDDCVAAGGVPAGWGTRCDTDPCAPFVACCLLDGTCFMATEGDCLAVCGTPQGAGSTCEEVSCP